MNKLRKFAASIGITFVVFIPLLFSSPAAADTASGLNVDVYTYDSSATPDRQPYTLCKDTVDTAWTHVDNIDFDFDAQYNGIVGGCQGDFVLMHFTGNVVFPSSGTYAFLALADDGFWMSLDGKEVINDWYLKGRSGNVYTDVSIDANHVYAIDVWYYEYGGGANATLTYASDNGASGVFSVMTPFMFTSEVPVVTPPVVVPPVDPVPVDPQPPVVPVDPQPPVVVPPVDPQPPVVVPPVVTPPVVTPPVKEPSVAPVPPTQVPTSTPTTPQEPTKVPVQTQPEPPTVTDPSQVAIGVVSVLSSIAPQDLTTAQVADLTAAANVTLDTAPEGSPVYQQALDALMVAAQADDIQVDPQLAAVPVLGNVAVGVTNAINALGNLGSDMSPAHRAKAKKEIVAAVVATGAAVNAVASAAGAASVSSGSSSTSRRKQD